MNRYDKLMVRIEGDEQIVIDGATGTEIEQRGVPQLNDAWNGGGALSHPDILRQVHEDYILAGAQIIISNTFATLKSALRDAGVEEDFKAYNCRGVELACEAFGVAQDDPRGLTTTGGLPYHGGPVNNYTIHGLVTVAERCRAEPGSVGLATGNGWYLTKHSATLLSRQPGTLDSEFATRTIEDTSPRNGEPSAVPVVVRSQADGASTVETYTVVHGRDGMPNQGIIIGRLLDSGERFLANTPTDPGLLADLESNETVGARGTVRHEAGHNIFRPA